MQPDNLAGTTLGQYQILEELGRGGMAVVYKAWQASLRRYVALKVLLPHLLTDPEFVQRFQQEAIVAANLRNPHIVTIYEVGEQNGTIFIAMEYVEGHSLEQIIVEGKAVPLPRALHILEQVADALDYAHRQYLIHRDIKPANILIDAEDRAVITDFGIAKALEGSGATAKLTASGMIMGTPAYMSPEQIQEQAVDYRTDLYSLGIVAYEMLTGRVPFDGNTTSVLYAQVNKLPPRVTETNPALPLYVEDVLTRMLAKQPGDRFATAGAFVTALASAGSEKTPLTKGGTAVLPETLESVPQREATMPAPPPFSPPPALSIPLAQGGTPYSVTVPPQRRKGIGLLWWVLGGGAFLLLLIAAFVVGVIFKPWQWGKDADVAPLTQEAAEQDVTEKPLPSTKEVVTTPTVEETAVVDVRSQSLDKIAFVSERDGNAEIYIMNSDGSGQYNLTNSPQNEYYPRWSPDGTKISYFLSPPNVEPKDRTSQIYWIDVATEERSLVDTGFVRAMFADWAPDGTALVFSAATDKVWNLYIITLGTGEVRSLTQNEGNDYCPTWSPDGKYIAFYRDDGKDQEIYKIDLESNDIYNLSNNPLDWEWQPSWSPDGGQILFTGQQNGEREVYLMDVDGAGRRQLTDAAGVIDSQPQWNFSGDQFVFRSDRDGDQEIYRMDVDGTNLMRLTDNPSDDYYPDWR